MRKFILLFLLLFGVVIFGQTHRFIYEYQYRMSAEDTLKTKATYHLDINSDKTYYYERKYYIADSLDRAKQPMYFEGKMTDIFTKNKTSGTVSLITFKGFDAFLLKDNPTQNWKVHKETKTLGNLKLQKATTSWSGRNWEAWFASEIPFQEGPHKFSGLPGLIVELSDDKDNFDFELIRYQAVEETYVMDVWYNNKHVKPIEISYDRYSKMEIEYYKSPLKSLIAQDFDYKKSPLITDEGHKIDTDQKFRDYEVDERARIKKYNNPIELDRKVKYPEK